MLPQPLYRPEDLRPAYQLRYGWTGWPSDTPFPTDLLRRILPEIAPEWEKDGLRVLESALAPEQLQLTLSTTPQVSPVTLAGRVKGRIQHHCRRLGKPVDFSRKLRGVRACRRLATELLHLPGEPAGVEKRARVSSSSHRTASPAGRAGRGRGEHHVSPLNPLSPQNPHTKLDSFNPHAIFHVATQACCVFCQAFNTRS